MPFFQIPLGWSIEPDLSELDEKILATVNFSFNKLWAHSKLKNVDIARLCGKSEAMISRRINGWQDGKIWRDGLIQRGWLIEKRMDLRRKPEGSERRTSRRLTLTRKAMRAAHKFIEKPKPDLKFEGSKLAELQDD